GAVDENPDQTITPGSRDEAVGLHRGDIQARGDLALGEAASVMQPGGARRQAGVVVKWLKRPVAAAHASTLQYFSIRTKFHRPAGLSIARWRFCGAKIRRRPDERSKPARNAKKRVAAEERRGRDELAGVRRA